MKNTPKWITSDAFDVPARTKLYKEGMAFCTVSSVHYMQKRTTCCIAYVSSVRWKVIIIIIRQIIIIISVTI